MESHGGVYRAGAYEVDTEILTEALEAYGHKCVICGQEAGSKRVAYDYGPDRGFYSALEEWHLGELKGLDWPTEYVLSATNQTVKVRVLCPSCLRIENERERPGDTGF